MQNCKIANNCQPNLSAQRLSDFNSQRLDDTRTITRSRKRKQKDVDDSDYQPNNEWQPKTKKRKLIHSRIDSLVIHLPPHFYDESTQNVHDVIKIMHEAVYEKYNIFSHF